MTDSPSFQYHQHYLVKIDGMDGDVIHGPGETCNAIFHALTNGAKSVSVKICKSEQQKEIEQLKNIKNFQTIRIRDVRSALEEALNQSNIVDVLDGMRLTRLLGSGEDNSTEVRCNV